MAISPISAKGGCLEAQTLNKAAVTGPLNVLTVFGVGVGVGALGVDGPDTKID